MKFRAYVLAALVACTSFCFADSTVDGILAAITKQGRADKLSSPLISVDLGDQHYVCRISDGRLISSAKAKHASVGVVGDWVEVSTMPLDAQSHPAAQGAGWLLHRTGKTWQLVATNEGPGYSKEALRKAKLPADIQAKLKLEVLE